MPADDKTPSYPGDSRDEHGPTGAPKEGRKVYGDPPKGGDFGADMHSTPRDKRDPHANTGSVPHPQVIGRDLNKQSNVERPGVPAPFRDHGNVPAPKSHGRRRRR